MEKLILEIWDKLGAFIGYDEHGWEDLITKEDCAKEIDTLTKAHYQKLFQEKIEALEELCALRGELIDIYAKEAPTENHFKLSDRKLYNELRQKISELESKLKEV
jgi:hypothetical protein